MQNVRIVRALVFPLFLLAVPLAASFFSSEFNWTPSDFVFAYVLWAGAALAYVLFTKNTQTYQRKLTIGIAVFLVLAFVWVGAATGFEGVFDRLCQAGFFEGPPMCPPNTSM